MNRITLNTLSILFAAALPAFAQDVTLTSKMNNDGKVSTAVTYMSKDHVRVVNGDGTEMLLDAASGSMTTIDTAKRTYFVITRADMDTAAVKMQERMNSPEMKRAQEAMKSHPQMAGMFDVDVKDTGVSRRVGGYSCKVWTLSVGTMSSTEECLTTDLKLPMNVWDTYQKFSEGMKNMMSAMGPMGAGVAKTQEKMKNMKGYPIASKTTMDIAGRKMVVDSELVNVQRGAIPSSVWEVPAGYTKVENPMLRALNHHRS